MTEKEKDEFIKQLQEEVGKWHHAYDALMIERNSLASNQDCIVVTSVQVFPFKQTVGNVLALASIVLNDQFLIRGLRVMDGENGLFVGYPNDPFYKGEDFRCICNPITRKLREHIEKSVLDKYNATVAIDGDTQEEK